MFYLRFLFCFMISTMSFLAHAENSLYQYAANWKDSWKNEKGEKVSLTQFKGRPVVMTMSYTSCKRVCPHLTMKKLKEIQKLAKDQDIAFEFVIITFDPENDTPEVLRHYKKKMEVDYPNWHFLTSDTEQIKLVANFLGLQNFWTMDDHINHDFGISVLNSRGEVERLIDWDHQDVKAIFSNPSKFQ